MLTGAGPIEGALTVGSGMGNGAIIAPGSFGIGIIRTSGSLLFNADATYACQIDSDEISSDQVAAARVTIAAGALCNCTDLGTTALVSGTSFTLISSIGADPIEGVFANLPDGGVVAIGPNSYRISYEGGDGNDLTLTVQ